MSLGNFRREEIEMNVYNILDNMRRGLGHTEKVNKLIILTQRFFSGYWQLNIKIHTIEEEYHVRH